MAWAGAGGSLRDSKEPAVRHFRALNDATDFLGMSASGARAIGFFGSVDAPEHAVFLTVAKQMASPDMQHAGVRIDLGRANIGRGTEGGSIYLQPCHGYVSSSSFGAGVPLLAYQYWLPQTPNDAALHEAWRRTQPPTTASPQQDLSQPPPSPPPIQMWQEVLESEAFALHRFLQSGALPHVSALITSTTIGTSDAGKAALTMLDEVCSVSHFIGMLIFQSHVSSSIRSYHLKRLSRTFAGLATGKSPLPACRGDGTVSDSNSTALFLARRCGDAFLSGALRPGFARRFDARCDWRQCWGFFCMAIRPLLVYASTEGGSFRPCKC